MKRFNIVYGVVFGSYKISEGLSPFNESVSLDSSGNRDGDDLKVQEFFRRQRDSLSKRGAEVYISAECPCDEGVSLVNCLNNIPKVKVFVEHFKRPVYDRHADLAKQHKPDNRYK